MTTTLGYTVLGAWDSSNLAGDLVQLSNGDLFALRYVQDSTTPIQSSAIEFLKPSSNSIANVTAQAISGPLPANIDSTPLLALLPVGTNALPDIVIGDGGLDQSPWYGGNIRVLTPNAAGQYVDVSSQLGLETNYNHRVSTGTIDGQAAIVVAMLGGENGALKGGIELEIANQDGTFSNWTSHLPAAAQDTTGIISNAFGTTNYNYTYAAIGDFTGHGGDLFLGSENAFVNPSALLINDGSGHFTEESLNLPLPPIGNGAATDRNGYKAEWTVVYALPTKFAGDSHGDVIVVYADTASASYTGSDNTDPACYLQFLQGDGKGGFTDVTSAHLASQPTLTNSSGTLQWVVNIQQVNLNGFNDLILYAPSGAPLILVNDGQDHYSPSSELAPASLGGAVWGADSGVQGFFGYVGANWVFVPVSDQHLAAGSSSLSGQLTSKFYLYGAESAKSLQQTYDMTITVTAHEQIINGAVATLGVYANGQEIGTASANPTVGFTYNGSQFTNDQTFTFTLKGLTSLSSLQLTTSIPTVGDTIFISDVSVNGTDLAPSNANLDGWSGTGNATDTIDASAWNSALAASAKIGSAADPISVTGAGGESTAYVLGNHTQYSETGIGTNSLTLKESAGLNQNAVLTAVSYVEFQDGAILNTQTGAFSYAASLSESAATVLTNLDALEASVKAGLGAITLTDGSIPTLTITAAQAVADADALKAISSPCALVETVSGNASQYSITAAGDGVHLTLSGNGATYSVSGAQALKFSDFSDIVAATPGPANAITTGNITELYSAVLAREPDVGGLTFYQNFLKSNPTTPLQTFAEYFLNSTEYTAAHNYAQSVAGDEQFITDSYQNLLHRTPSSDEVSFYETNVLAKAEANLTPGTSAYGAAQLQAHALMLVYFSASAEFLADVQVTAQHPTDASHWLVLI
jgi:hypothetical protein